MAPVSAHPILNWAQNYLYTLQIHTFYPTNYSWITKQLLGDINFYVANMKCSYEPVIYFHGEVKERLRARR